MIFELWEAEGENLYIAQSGDYKTSIANERKRVPDLKLVWTFKAKSYFEAMQAKNDYYGYGLYKPEADWEDIFYDED